MQTQPNIEESRGSPWLDTPAAAKYLAASPNTLRQWRACGRGPRYHVAGGRLVRYHVDYLDAFVRGKVNTLASAP